MISIVRPRRTLLTRIAFLVFAAWFVSPPLLAAPQASTPAPALLPELSVSFNTLRASFWRAENALVARAVAQSFPPDRTVYLAHFAAPIKSGDTLHAEYSRAASAAAAYLARCEREEVAPAGLPAVLYLGGSAFYTLGDYPRALELWTRLRTEYPDYKRHQYINDRDLPDERYSVPVAAAIDKLRFFLHLTQLPAAPSDALAGLRRLTEAARAAFASQRQYAAWVAAKSDKYNISVFEDGRFGAQPDGIRASALPHTLQLLESGWEKYVSLAAAQNASGLRQWLREEVAAGGAVEVVARRYLEKGDTLLIAALFNDAQNFLNANNFDGARAKFRHVVAEWPQSESARRAEMELSKIAPRAVEYFRAEGHKSFAPQAAGQFRKPQDKAAQYFAQMLREINSDATLASQADEALLGLAQAQSTQGKLPEAVSHLQTLLKTYPRSEHAAQAQFQLGFILGGNTLRQYDAATDAMQKVWTDFPQSEFAPSALWHAAFFRAFQNRHAEGLPFLEKLQQEYSGDARARHAAKWITVFRERAKP